MDFHEVARIFPLMGEEEFSELKADIVANGQRVPIYTHDGKIVDGRNRYRACVEAGITPRFEAWDGRGSLVAFVVSLNLMRRHLTSSQKAAVAVDMLPALEAEARDRQRGGQGGILLSQKIDEASEGRAADQAANIVGSNRQYVSDAKKLKEESPALFEKIKSGELSMTQAKREFIRDNAPEPPAMPSGKYRVFYADPPWKYGNTMPLGTSQPDDHYPLMTIDEICELPIAAMSEENAVLFLWATSPILEEAFEVVRAWGFKYKASFIWDKVKHNMGHYNSVRHEFLLVCVRGSCQPDVQKLFDSVVTEERTAHSKKPDIFRSMIDTLYPRGDRIELFAREAHAGWTSYGNECQQTSISR